MRLRRSRLTQVVGHGEVDGADAPLADGAIVVCPVRPLGYREVVVAVTGCELVCKGGKQVDQMAER